MTTVDRPPDRSGGRQPNRSEKLDRVREWAASLPAESPELSDAEAAELARHEEVISAGLKTFQQVGAALVSVRDGSLFRATHATFEAYIADRWGMSDRQGRRLMAATQVAELTGPMGPANERVARELAPLVSNPGRLTRVWQEAQRQAGDSPPTAQHVIAAREATENREAENRAPRVIRERGEGEGEGTRGIVRRIEAPHEDPTRVVRITPVLAVPTDLAVLTDVTEQAVVLARKASELWRHGALDRTPTDVRAELGAQHRRIAELHLVAAELAETTAPALSGTVIDDQSGEHQ